MQNTIDQTKLIALAASIKDISDTNQDVEFLDQYDTKLEFLEISELADSILDVLVTE